MRAMTLTVAIALIAAPAPAAEAPVATVGNKTITRAELEKEMAPQLMEVEQQRYDVLREGLDNLVAQALVEQEAAARKTTVEDLVEKEIVAKASKPTDAEVQQVYDENKQALGGASLDDVKERIVEFLETQKAEQRRGEYLAELRKKYKTNVNLAPPKVEVGKGTRPPMGKKDAPITIVMFSDYECPFCKRAETTVDEVIAAYKDKVVIYYRDYPLPFHPNAKTASEAAHCANAQGKFWEYHKKVMASEDLSKAALQKIAGDSGLDMKKFDSCLDAGTFKEAVALEISEGEAVGIDGTPAFFINGRRLSGAQPFERFKEIIDEELAGS